MKRRTVSVSPDKTVVQEAEVQTDPVIIQPASPSQETTTTPGWFHPASLGMFKPKQSHYKPLSKADHQMAHRSTMSDKETKLSAATRRNTDDTLFCRNLWEHIKRWVSMSYR